MKDFIINKRRATKRAGNLASLILENEDRIVENSIPPSSSPSDNTPPRAFSSMLHFISYSSTFTASQSSTETIDAEPSLGATGRAVSIAVMVTLLLFFCLGVVSYFCWRKRTRFYKEKGQILRVWNNNHSRKQPPSPTLASSTVSELGNCKRPRSEMGNELATSNIATESDITHGFKKKILATLLTWKFSGTFSVPSRPVTAPPTAITANRYIGMTISTPPAPPATVALSTIALAGYIPDPVVGAYMDRARREYAAHLAKTGNYPPHYLNPITAPNLLAPTVLISPSQENSDVACSSSTTFGSLNKKPKSVWERTSDLLSNRRLSPRDRCRVSKNHVSRFFQENARPHSYPLYAPQYDSDEEGDEDDIEEGAIGSAGHGEGDNRWRQVLDKEGRAYRHPNDFMVRTPMTVQEAQAAAARIMALGEERKRMMEVSQSEDVRIPPLPVTVAQTPRP